MLVEFVQYLVQMDDQQAEQMKSIFSFFSLDDSYAL